jgi:DNA-binding transcriptional LysR family regulator
MNIHHLELFYYVARHGGISRAVRNMPYGIQQPAVSSQIILLEEDLGVKLFERSPFKLTRAGEELFDFVRPFFENLDAMTVRLRKQSAPLLRIGASELVLRDYLPAVIGRLREHEPKLRLGLRSGFQAELEKWLLDREIDLAITPLDAKPPARLRCLRLLRLPLVLLVHKKSKIKSAAALLALGAVEEPLICLPQSEVMSRNFRKGLQLRQVDWPQAIEASSMDLVTRYVANGYGIGLSVNAAEVVKHPAVRVLPLDGFEPVEVAALWNGELTALLRAMLEESQRYIAQQWPDWAMADKLA